MQDLEASRRAVEVEPRRSRSAVRRHEGDRLERAQRPGRRWRSSCPAWRASTSGTTRHWTRGQDPARPRRMRMKINFDKLEERELERARLRAKGQGVGALMDMETQFHLDDVEGGTHALGGGRKDRRAGGLDGAARAPADRQPAGPQVLNALDRQAQTAQSSASWRPVRRADERHRWCAAAVAGRADLHEARVLRGARAAAEAAGAARRAATRSRSVAPTRA